MASTHFTIFTLFTIFLLSSSSASPFSISVNNKFASFSSSSIYDVLNSHGLPVGLLPKGINNFSIDPSSGRFEVHLPQSCAAKFETHLRYDSTVSGILNYGQISEISGVAAEELFLWFSVKGIRVDIPSSGLIYFDVGVVSKQFSLSFFEIPRDCTITNDGLLEDLILFDNRGRIVENLSRKLIKERPGNSKARAVS
uniref:Putative ovule protein n=1 Tax=Solanum chacoense TaxID=4108 RepID=A0A0V0HL55_SOLCH